MSKNKNIYFILPCLLVRKKNNSDRMYSCQRYWRLGELIEGLRKPQRKLHHYHIDGFKGVENRFKKETSILTHIHLIAVVFPVCWFESSLSIGCFYAHSLQLTTKQVFNRQVSTHSKYLNCLGSNVLYYLIGDFLCWNSFNLKYWEIIVSKCSVYRMDYMHLNIFYR